MTSSELPILQHLDIRPALSNKKTWEGYEIRWWNEKKKRHELHPGRNSPPFVRALLEDGFKHFRKRQRPYEDGLLLDAVALDPLAGIGTVLVEAVKLADKYNLNLQAVGYEIWPQAVALAAQNLQPYPDCAEMRARDFKSVTFPVGAWADLVVTSPPFPNNHGPGESAEQDRMRETRGMGAGHAWSGLPADITSGNLTTYWDRLAQVWENMLEALKPGCRAYVITRDYVLKNQTVPYTAQVAALLQRVGFRVLGRVVRPLLASGYHQRRIKHFKTKGLGVPVFIDHEDALVAEKP